MRSIVVGELLRGSAVETREACNRRELLTFLDAAWVKVLRRCQGLQAIARIAARTCAAVQLHPKPCRLTLHSVRLTSACRGMQVLPG